MAADQPRAPLALLYDVGRDSMDVLTDLCTSRAPVRRPLKRSNRQLDMTRMTRQQDEPGFKRTRLEANSFTNENSEFSTSFFLVHFKTDLPSILRRCKIETLQGIRI